MCLPQSLSFSTSWWCHQLWLPPRASRILENSEGEGRHSGPLLSPLSDNNACIFYREDGSLVLVPLEDDGFLKRAKQFPILPRKIDKILVLT